MSDFLASYDRVKSIIECVVVSIIGVILVAVGIHLLMQPKRTATVQGVVQSNDPVGKTSTIAYNVGDKSYSFSVPNSVMPLNTTVTVDYDPNLPSNARLNTQISNRTLAIILIVGSLIIMGLVYLHSYFVLKSKSYAAVEGGLDIASQAANIIRNA